MVVLANSTVTIDVGRAASQLTDAAVFSFSCKRCETFRASAHSLPVDDFAQGVRSTRFFAWVHAFSLLAHGISWTIFVSTRAVTFDLHSTSGRVGISDVVRWALADGATACGFADSSWVTNVGVAGLDWRAFYVSDGIGSETDGTLTAGLVIFRNAHRVGTASIFHASVVAFVFKTIAQLRGRTVVVINAGDLLATL